MSGCTSFGSEHPRIIPHAIFCYLDWLRISLALRVSVCVKQILGCSFLFEIQPLCIYIYICSGVIIWAKFGFLRCYYLGQVCFFTKHCLSKNTTKIWVSTLFIETNCARKFEVLLSGPSWQF